MFRHKQRYDTKTHHKKAADDFASFYRFSDPIYGSATGNSDRPMFKELEMAATERSGVGRYITFIFGSNCVKNGFDFFDWENNYVKKPKVSKDLYKAGFHTEQIHWVNWELTFGISFLVKMWSAHDKFNTPPPNRPPLAYKAFPPTLMSPANITDTKMLTEDVDKWDFYGGKYNNFKIHHDRVEILCTRPNPKSWIGYSIIEPIYLSYVAYNNLIINGVKGIAKHGNVVPVFRMAHPNPSSKMYLEYKKMVNDMKGDLTFIVGKDEEITFLEAKVGSGLAELGEFLKEDMMAGTGLALNNVFGRSDGGGLSGAGALMADQHELRTSANYQSDLADNYWALIDQYWDVDDLFLKFRLEQQKTDRARYEEESLQWDIELKKAQSQQIQLQNLVLAVQSQFQMDHPETMLGGPANQSGGKPANQIGNNPGNGSQKQLENKSSPQMEKVKKASQDFINDMLVNFKPRTIDKEFRL